MSKQPLEPSALARQIRDLNAYPNYYDRVRFCGLLIRQAVKAGLLSDSKFDSLRMELECLDVANDAFVLDVVVNWARENELEEFHHDPMRPDGMLAMQPIEHNINAVADLLENAEIVAATARAAIQLTDHGNIKSAGQSDKKADSGKKRETPKREPSTETKAVARMIVKARKSGESLTIKQAIKDYLEKNEGSASSIARELTDNPNLWKERTKTDTNRTK